MIGRGSFAAPNDAGGIVGVEVQVEPFPTDGTVGILATTALGARMDGPNAINLILIIRFKITCSRREARLSMMSSAVRDFPRSPFARVRGGGHRIWCISVCGPQLGAAAGAALAADGRALYHRLGDPHALSDRHERRDRGASSTTVSRWNLCIESPQVESPVFDAAL
jgi:hypothetical protein